VGQFGDQKYFKNEEFSNGYIFAWLNLRKNGHKSMPNSIQSSSSLLYYN
jgi:hypothetical protein